MSRRSSRLVSGGYYNSDEESDSSSVTNISYRENPVKVFKKKAGPRKAASRTSSRANSNSSATAETPSNADQYEALTPSPLSSQVTMRTVSYVSSTPTPRPALTPSGSRSQTPIRSPSTLPERSCYTRHCSSSASGLHLRSSQKEAGQSGVDSSGYSSSEGAYRKSSVTSKLSGASEAPCVGYRSRISSAFYSLIESASSAASSTTTAAHSSILHLTSLVGAPSFRRHLKKAGVVLLLLILLLCVWLLLPFFTSCISRLTSTKTVSQTNPLRQPVIPATRPPPPPPQPSVAHSSPVVDPAVVSAAVEEKMERLLVELQVKQEHLLSQMKKSLQLDLQAMKAQLEAADSSSWVQLQQEVTGLSQQIAGYQADSRSAAAGLSLRVQTLESQGAQLSQDLSSIQLLPPPAPCPEPSAAPVLNHLTPELQQAMEKWFTDRVKEQDAIRLADKGSCTDCGRPMADKMADFALETQGASVVSTRCSETYRIRSACVTLFGFPLWYPSESPRTVIQGYPVLLPGKCWAFHGVQGTLVISLSHPVRITHVTLDHLPRYNSPTGRIDSAPKDFEVYGMKNGTEEGKLLGRFTYDEYGESTQTFKLPNPSDVLHRFVELRVLSNWGHIEYTCLYRFRVHGKMASAS